MTTEEAALLKLLRADDGLRALDGLSHRNRAIAHRMAANTNYVRIVCDIACLTHPGSKALDKHVEVFG